MCENSIVTNNFKLPTKRFNVRKFDNSLERKLYHRRKNKNRESYENNKGNVTKYQLCMIGIFFKIQ